MTKNKMTLKDNNFLEKFVWKKEYSIVLILNVLYILYFGYVMIAYI